MQLLLERARAVEPAFGTRPEDASTVVAICARLEGLPLAIELAAAHAAVLSPRQMLERLEGSFDLLAGGSRTAPGRQRTMRATLDWSHSLLSDEQQTLLRRLAVFAGGWSLEGAEAVCSDEKLPAAHVLPALSGLVDAWLVVTTRHDGQARYRLLEPIRQYAREQLVARAELEGMQRRHARYFLQFAEGLHVDAHQGGPRRRAPKVDA